MQSGDSVLSTPWKDITIFCKGAGNGGLASNTSTQDEPLAPPTKYDGKLTIADSALVKRNQCPRQGQVVFRINSNSSSAVSYRLDGSNGQSWTGTLQMFPKGPGKYQGVGAKTFNVSKTDNVTFSLKCVKGDKAYMLDFGVKQFTCKTPAVETGSNDIKVAPRPNTGNTRVPATLVPSALDKAKADAARRRIEAAKKAVEAMRKRKVSAKARKVKAARDASIAKRKRDVAAKKSALATAKKKRDAALRLCRLQIQQAAIKRAAALALAKRQAAAAKKRAAPRSTGAAPQRRVIRRR